MSKFSGILLSVWLVIIGCGVHAEPTTASQAFQLQAQVFNQQLLLHWQIAPGFQLYRARIAARIQSPSTIQLGPLQLPTGIAKQDAILGHYEVYQQAVQASVPLYHYQPSEFRVLVDYQGCSTTGFCYPPERRLLTVQISPFGASVQNIEAVPLPIVNQEPVSLHISHHFGLALFSFFMIGILLAFTPCVLPMLPILSSIVIGKQRTTQHAFLLSLTYVLAMSIAYAAAGLLAGLLGTRLQAALQTPWVLLSFVIVFVALALSLFDVYHLQLPTRWQTALQNIDQKQKSGSYIGAAIMGALSILIVSPCVSAPLVAALSYIAQSGHTTRGGILLLVMGLGMGTPLLIVGTFGARWIPKSGAWMHSVKIILGILLLVTAIWLLYRLIPGRICLILWGLLAMSSAIYLGAAKFKKMSRKTIVWFFLLWLWFLMGIVYLVGGILGNHDPLHPLTSTQQTSLSFIKIHNLTDLQQALHKASGKVVLLDVYADWCVSCKIIEQNIFNQSDVQTLLKNVLLLQMDVSANNADDKALQNYLQVYAPPTIIFFDKDGKEIKTDRLVGEVSKQRFIQTIKSISQ